MYFHPRISTTSSRPLQGTLSAIALLLLLPLCATADTKYPQANPALADFRILPYLQAPSSTSIQINWFTTAAESGTLVVKDSASGTTVRTLRSTPKDLLEARYSALEESERSDFPDMFDNASVKHAIQVKGLTADTAYAYEVTQGNSTFRGTFKTAPLPDTQRPLRLIAFADSETDPDGRHTYRNWDPAKQHADSTGRPEDITKYLVTETRGFIENIKVIESRKPDLVLMAGDLVQGGGYQRAWDEFFFHLAGKFDDLMTHTPLLMALGNWETFGARNGEYAPEAIHKSRRKSLAYIDGPPNNNPKYKDAYYRVDYGPVTVLTLDSCNGLPDDTDFDTNINIDAATYPGDDMPDMNQGSDQWNWCMAQLQDARERGQIIFVQFHHVPYSSGGHILPVSMEDSSGQAGLPMRIYTPAFQRYGVVAVLCGHNETFERSLVGDVIFYDAGVAGDGLGAPESEKDPRCTNPWQAWIAHDDDPELWNGKQLVDGGRHYGHVEIDITPDDTGWNISLTPVYIFPVNDEGGNVTGFERRVYDDVVTLHINREGLKN